MLVIVQHLEAEDRPDIIHGDTQSQREPTFLAYLIGAPVLMRSELKRGQSGLANRDTEPPMVRALLDFSIR